MSARSLQIDATVDAGDGFRVTVRRSGFSGLIVEIFDHAGVVALFHAVDLAEATIRATAAIADATAARRRRPASPQ